MQITTVVLLSAAIGVFGIGLVYLTNMELILGKYLPKDASVTLKHVIRSNYGGTFPAFAILFLLGALVPSYTFTALVSLLVFMAGFAVGRILSIVKDGMPNVMMLGITAVEVIYSVMVIYLLTTRTFV